tara:strand:+ start:174 stop:2375 length:2202 start_codon:yes stop_codon:yes gene_type:complete
MSQRIDAEWEKFGKSNASKELDRFKIIGSKLLKSGKITKKEYNHKVRDKAVNLGVLREDEYPDLLPYGVETFSEIGGAVAGTIIGAPLGIAGASAGAGVGAGVASYAADKIGAWLNPDIPKPDNDDMIADALTIGAINTVGTGVLMGAGRLISMGVEPTKRAFSKTADIARKKTTEGISAAKGQIDDGTTTLGKLAKPQPTAKDAQTFFREDVLKTVGRDVDLPIGVTTGFAPLQAMFNLTSRMPMMVGRKKVQNIFNAIDDYSSKVFSPSVSLTQAERSTLIGESSKRYFDKMQKKIFEQYDEGWKILDNVKYPTTTLRSTIQSHLPREITKTTEKNIGTKAYKTGFTKNITQKETSVIGNKPELMQKMPKDVEDYLSKVLKEINNNKKLTGKDLKLIEKELTTFAQTYNPNPITGNVVKSPNRAAFNAVTDAKMTIKRLMRNESIAKGGNIREAQRLLDKADKSFGKMMNILVTKNTKILENSLGQFRKAGGYRKPAKEYEDLLNKSFFPETQSQKSVQSLRELKKVIGKEDFNKLATNHIDEIFGKFLKTTEGGLKQEIDIVGLKKALGLVGNRKSLTYDRTKEMISGFENMNMKRLEGFINMLENFPAVIPDLNQFIMRSGTLRMASGATSAALIGSSAFTGGTTGMIGFGTLFAVNYLLSQPSMKQIASLAATQGARGTKYTNIIKNKFLTLIRKINGIYKDLPQNQGATVAAAQLATVPAAQAITDN